MNKICRIVTILIVLVLTSSPGFALESKLSGFYDVRGIANNFAAGNNFIGTLANDAGTETIVDQRFRLKLDSKVNDLLSFTYYGEVDMQWGDEQYSNEGRNDGGGLGGDTTNLESKHVYMDVKLPTGDSSFRVGLQGFADNYDYSFLAADMAGVTYRTTFKDTKLTAGWLKLADGVSVEADDVTLWALQSEYTRSANLKFGADYYYYQNEGSQAYGTNFGTADIEAVVGTALWTGNRTDMDLHYLGGNLEYRLANLLLSGWINVNAGTVDDINNDTASPLVTEDLDVQGFAGRLEASTVLGNLQMSLSGTYFSGDDDLTDGDANFIVNPMPTETFAFATDGFMIFTPDIGWNSVGQYGFAMTDAAYAGYGLTSVALIGAYEPEQLKNSYFKAGIGYFAAQEDTLAAGDPRTDRAGTALGTEVYLRAGFVFAEKLDLSVNGAYAALGDFYDNHGGGTAVNTAMTDVDNPYEVYLKANLSF